MTDMTESGSGAVKVAEERAELWALCEREAAECRAVAAAIEKMEKPA